MDVALRIGSPDVLHQLLPGENLSGIGGKLIQQLKLLLGQNIGLSVPPHGEAVKLQYGAAHRLPPVRNHLGTAQKGIDTQHHLIDIHRLDHKIVGARQKTQLHILKPILCGDHQHGNVGTGIPKGLYQLIAIYPGHHNVGHDQIHDLPVQHFQRLLPVIYRNGLKPRAAQHAAKQLLQLHIVFSNQNTEHGIPPERDSCCLYSIIFQENINES